MKMHYPNNHLEIVLSIMSEHAEKIYSKKKVYELRKTMPTAGVPRRVFLYETGEVGAITGHVVVSKVLVGTPDEVWSEIGGKSTTKNRFFKYYQNRSTAYAYEIECAVKYSGPIDRELIFSSDDFRTPQSFAYLSEHEDSLKLLNKIALEGALKKSRGVCLAFIDECNREDFVKEVEKHISGSYMETGAKYGKKLLETHDLGRDVEGIFTKYKYVMEVRLGAKRIGFAVLTIKAGGCVKTGPVILESEYRNKGYGKKLRSYLHEALNRAGYRKIYCTIPIKNDEVFRYLVSSGYKVEAHLSKHYHKNHDELVLGYNLLETGEMLIRTPKRESFPPNDFMRIKSYSEELEEFLLKNFHKFYFSVSRNWVRQQIKSAASFSKGKRNVFKPRLIYIGVGFSLVSAALVIFKRGGAVKVLIISDTTNVDSLERFINYIENSIVRLKGIEVRKLYTLVSILDNELIRSFYRAGYKQEGLIDKPYNSFDMIMMSKNK